MALSVSGGADLWAGAWWGLWPWHPTQLRRKEAREGVRGSLLSGRTAWQQLGRECRGSDNVWVRHLPLASPLSEGDSWGLSLYPFCTWENWGLEWKVVMCLRTYSWETAEPRLIRQNTLPSRSPAGGRKLPKRPSRFLKDSDSGWRVPVFRVSGKCVGLVILSPEHKRGMLWLWFQCSDVYLSLNTKPKSECLVTLAESAAAAAGVFTFCTQLCHFCLEPAEPLWHLLFFFFFFNSFGANNMLCWEPCFVKWRN